LTPQLLDGIKEIVAKYSGSLKATEQERQLVLDEVAERIFREL